MARHILSVTQRSLREACRSTSSSGPFGRPGYNGERRRAFPLTKISDRLDPCTAHGGRPPAVPHRRFTEQSVASRYVTHEETQHHKKKKTFEFFFVRRHIIERERRQLTARRLNLSPTGTANTTPIHRARTWWRRRKSRASLSPIPPQRAASCYGRLRAGGGATASACCCGTRLGGATTREPSRRRVHFD